MGSQKSRQTERLLTSLHFIIVFAVAARGSSVVFHFHLRERSALHQYLFHHLRASLNRCPLSRRGCHSTTFSRCSFLAFNFLITESFQWVGLRHCDKCWASRLSCSSNDIRLMPFVIDWLITACVTTWGWFAISQTNWRRRHGNSLTSALARKSLRIWELGRSVHGYRVGHDEWFLLSLFSFSTPEKE